MQDGEGSFCFMILDKGSMDYGLRMDGMDGGWMDGQMIIALDR